MDVHPRAVRASPLGHGHQTPRPAEPVGVGATMRNSVMPMVMVMSVALGAWVMFHAEIKQSKPGINGPDLNPGIFRLPKKDKFHVDSAPLVVSDEVDAASQPPANRGESWRVVLLEAKDREPVTRSTVLALAERLTSQGCVALITLVDSPSFPMGVSRIVSVATTQVQAPTELGGELRATLGVTTSLARLPDGHPAITLLPNPEGPVRAALTIRHQSHADVVPAGWPNRWAGEGRALAQTILDRLAPGGLPPVVDSETRTWLPDLIPLSDWGSALTLPPTTERLRWEFAFQEHLVRGWVGLVPGLTTTNRSGVEEPTLDQLLQRMKSGDWQEASAPGVRLFSRTLPERTEWFSIAQPTDATGWSVVWWQERSGMPDLLETWGDAAAKGERSAARLLHAYRDCPALPKQFQDAARQVPAAAGK